MPYSDNDTLSYPSAKHRGKGTLPLEKIVDPSKENLNAYYEEFLL